MILELASQPLTCGGGRPRPHPPAPGLPACCPSHPSPSSWVDRPPGRPGEVDSDRDGATGLPGASGKWLAGWVGRDFIITWLRVAGGGCRPGEADSDRDGRRGGRGIGEVARGVVGAAMPVACPSPFEPSLRGRRGSRWRDRAAGASGKRLAGWAVQARPTLIAMGRRGCGGIGKVPRWVGGWPCHHHEVAVPISRPSGGRRAGSAGDRIDHWRTVILA